MIAVPPKPAPTTPLRQPNQIALTITGRPYISHSQLNLMRSCPFKFSCQYVRKFQPDFQPSSLIFGGSIHSALEFYMRARLEGLKVTQGALLSAFHDSWRRQREQVGQDVPVRFNAGEDDDKLHDLADRMLKAFLASPLAAPKGTILGIEEELKVVLHPDLPDLLAKVDLVTQTDGALHIVDFKTSRSKWTEAKAMESGEQLLLYTSSVRSISTHLHLPVHLHFAIITKAKKPVVQILPIPSNTEGLDALKDSIIQIWEAIQTGNFYPSPSPMNCTNCPFKSKCPIFKGK